MGIWNSILLRSTNPKLHKPNDSIRKLEQFGVKKMNVENRAFYKKARELFIKTWGDECEDKHEDCPTCIAWHVFKTTINEDNLKWITQSKSGKTQNEPSDQAFISRQVRGVGFLVKPLLSCSQGGTGLRCARLLLAEHLFLTHSRPTLFSHNEK